MRSTSDMNTSATNSSFQMFMKLKMRTVNKAARDMGSVIFQNSMAMLQPSMAAASSISLGKDRKKLARIKMATGNPKAAYRNTRASRLFVSDSLEKNMKRGSRVAWMGIIMPIVNRPRTTPESLHRIRAMAKARSEEHTSELQ